MGKEKTVAERLDKLLSGTGRWSRKEVKQLIKAGRVTVNGVLAADASGKYEVSSEIRVDGEQFFCEKYSYLMMNKPAGYLSVTEDFQQQTVLNLLPDHLRRIGLFPAGRLDKDSEGLLLLTNDGELAHRLLSPRHHVDKTYLVRVEGQLSASDVEAFESGMLLGDGLQCLPAGLRLTERSDTALVTLREGKYHQIKRMMSARGKPVRQLKRLTMGALTLDPALAPGEYRPLTAEERQALIS